MEQVEAQLSLLAEWEEHIPGGAPARREALARAEIPVAGQQDLTTATPVAVVAVAAGMVVEQVTGVAEVAEAATFLLLQQVLLLLPVSNREMGL
jgi:hypothetical protein